jgi:hypothetical protein
VAEHVRSLAVGSVQVHGNVALAPILRPAGRLHHLVLEEALTQGLTLREKDQPTVPWLLARNESGKHVLALEGEYVRGGGLQNRAFVRTVYLAPGFEGAVPVRCIESGRWSPGGDC